MGHLWWAPPRCPPRYHLPGLGCASPVVFVFTSPTDPTHSPQPNPPGAATTRVEGFEHLQ